MNRNKLLPLTAAIATAFLAPMTLAQEAALEEIVVTATKRATSLQDTPVTVNAFDSSTIQEAGINNASDLANMTPSLSINTNTSPFTSRLTIRGIGTAQTDPALEPSVGMFVDGVYIGRSGLGMSDLTDIERIEVLQGPQGTLYGKNTNAGAISITTKNPNMEEVEGYIKTSIGSRNLQNVTVAASGPITDNLGYRLSGNMNKQDGYLENATGANENGADDWNMIGKILWQASDQMSVQLNLSHVERDTNCCGSDTLQSPFSLSVLKAKDLTIIPNDSFDYQTSTNVDNEFTLEADAASLIVDYDLAMGNLISITSWDDYEFYNSYDVDGSELDSLAITDEFNAGDSISQEIRFSSETDGAIDYQAGLFYYQQTTLRGDGTPNVVIGPDFPTVMTALMNVADPQKAGLVSFQVADGDYAAFNHNWETETLALFGQATWNVTDSLDITAGLRWSDEEKDALLDAKGVSTAPAEHPILGPIPKLINLMAGTIAPTNFERRSINKDWMLNASYDLGQDTMLFASASTASKSGGFNGVNGPSNSREFYDEKTRSFELGVKTTLLDSRLRINATAFQTEVENYQQQLQLETGAGSTIRNEGALEVNGIDLNIDALPLPNLTISAGLLYLNKYELTEGPRTGDPLTYSADLSGNFAATYVLPVAEGTAYARLDYTFKGDHFTTVGSTYEQDLESFNLKMGWRDGQWDISVWGKNLTDRTYVSVAANTVAYNGNTSYFLAAPRTVGLTASYDF